MFIEVTKNNGKKKYAAVFTGFPDEQNRIGLMGPTRAFIFNEANLVNSVIAFLREHADKYDIRPGSVKAITKIDDDITPENNFFCKLNILLFNSQNSKECPMPDGVMAPSLGSASPNGIKCSHYIDPQKYRNYVNNANSRIPHFCSMFIGKMFKINRICPINGKEV